MGQVIGPNSGTGQSDSAPTPEPSDIFEELQVITFKYKQQPYWQGQEEAEFCSSEDSRSALVNDINEYIHCLNANIVAKVVYEIIFCWPLMLFPVFAIKFLRHPFSS